ncbi:uncharacterized protein LOC106638909 [Copidosoma floridanum]|uniref:uncharacterized protein LOC106638909 n=1 Tax=Copidosoma floridanum TaxID=29053 RepID=UPI0006C981A5|nr:uncharacterized protein LOC106638909 [Copidosoma floridanum]
MHLESNTPAKEMVQLNESLIQERRPSCLEEDLALSSSTHDTTNEKTMTELEEKSLDEETEPSDSPAIETTTTRTEASEPDRQIVESPTKPKTVDPTVVYEDAMDCNYDESSSTTNISTTTTAPTTIATNLQLWTSSKQFNLPDPETSPEMFCESDADDEAESTNTTTATSYPTNNTLEEPVGISPPSPVKLSQKEMVLKADKYLLKQVNKYLCGVPPPPNHTISQKDCDDFLAYIKQNRSYFWADPFLLDNGKTNEIDASLATSSQLEPSQQEYSQNSQVISNESKRRSPLKAGMRNLSMAFDECEKFSPNDSSVLDTDELEASICRFDLGSSLFSTSLLSMSAFAPTQSSAKTEDKLYDIGDDKCKDSPFNLSLLSTSTYAPTQNTVDNEDSKLGDISDSTDNMPTLYATCSVDEAKSMTWPVVYTHRCQGIYYNRNRSLEDFENLRMKLCERYIGAETQSTCNVWFAKQMPGSARQRSLLAKRNNGQSPGKRLSYLAKRRRTFSSANLQVLNFPEKKLMLNVKKGPMRKGKSPRGKSPRNGKSPRKKTPRSSAKKWMRRLQLEGPSPRKAKIETSKRALFQSPPVDKAGPSREVVATATTTQFNGANNPRKIKRALFQRTPKKNEAGNNDVESLSFPELKKRKSEEELERTRYKWAKSLSFDTPRNSENSASNVNPLRHSTSSVTSKYGSSNSGKCELSEAHRKKLLWAVAEALRSKGIGMSHPRFKQHASALARTVRKYMPDLENKNIPRKPGSTSDRMIKLAKRHVLLIIEAKKIESTC